MPLILAIEPDPRQAAQITAIARHRVGAELVLAGTTERALDVIGDRVPDLVLVPALLSPQDDAALAGALRVIAAAAHVRTLTIPVLAAGPKRPSNEGILAKWRRSRSGSPTPDGCDPAIFAEQISAYLKEAAADRAALEQEPAPIEETATVAEAQPILLGEHPIALVEPLVVVADQAAVVAEEPVAFDEEPVGVVEEPSFQLAAATWVEVDLSDELGAEAEESVFELEVDDANVVLFDEPAAISLAGPVAINIDEPAEELTTSDAYTSDALLADEESETIAEIFAALSTVDRFVMRSTRDAASPKRDLELWMQLSYGSGRPWPRLEGVLAESVAADDEALDPIADHATPSAHKPDAPKSERPEWAELIASLRQDIDRLRSENQVSPSVSPAPRANEPAPVRATGDTSPRKPKPRQAHKPAQDEWGFFDPEQCGFAALLAKLNETMEPGEESEVRVH